ncbi:MAG TPA: helix-turn-helix domain-containing protein [Polyangiaceae bacterium]|nr:helix-turn-helix domain-containing protein [Polyangiaceae bacterium]
MARPAEPEKRQELARRAVDVFARRGFDVPMSRIADELGMKRPTLLYHFPTRAHIVETALQDLLVEQASYVLERVEAHQHPIDRLYAQVRAVHEFHHGREARILLLTQAIAASGGRMDEIIAIGNRVFEAHRLAAADRIREGIRKGTVAPCDADALVSLVRAVIDGLMVQRLMIGADLAPAHEFLWTHVLLPLKRKPKART